MANLTRMTYWCDASHNVVQVAVGILDETWDLLCEAVELVGPFDDTLEALALAHARARAGVDRQMPGQMLLLDPGTPITPGMPGRPAAESQTAP